MDLGPPASLPSTQPTSVQSKRRKEFYLSSLPTSQMLTQDSALDGGYPSPRIHLSSPTPSHPSLSSQRVSQFRSLSQASQPKKKSRMGFWRPASEQGMLQGKWPTFCVVSNVWVLYRGRMCFSEKLEQVLRESVRNCTNICAFVIIANAYCLNQFERACGLQHSWCQLAFLTWCMRLHLTFIMAIEENRGIMNISIVIYGFQIHIWKHLQMLAVWFFFFFSVLLQNFISV